MRAHRNVEPQEPLAPPLPAGRIVNVPDRGEMFVREAEGPAGAPTVVLLHGWALSADLNWFAGVYDKATQHGRLLAVDLRGHGRGIRSDLDFSLEAAADDVAGVLEELDAAPAVLGGFSMGASVALLVWRRHRSLVAGLVLASSAVQWRTTLRDRVVWSGMAFVEYAMRFGNPEGVVNRYLREAVEHSPFLSDYQGWVRGEARRGDPADLAAAGTSVARFDARDFVGTIDVPVAVVVTLRDRLVPAGRQRELADAIPGAKVVEVDGPHNAWLLRPDAFAGAMDEGLRLVVGAAGATTPAG
jgi:3-oxoadipate enol-lactonase